MRVIIAGSKQVGDCDAIGVIDSCAWINFASCIVSGNSIGIDLTGETWAKQKYKKIIKYYPDWKKHGSRSSIMRNKIMADNAEGLIAIWGGKNRSTKSMIDFAKKKGLMIFIHTFGSKNIETINPSGPIADMWEIAQERAAIYEYDGGFDRLISEGMAGSYVYKKLIDSGV